MTTLSDQVKLRLIALTQRHGMKARLAKELGTVPSAITPIARGEREITLRILEALSRVSSIPVVELILPPESTVRELSASEARLIDALRRWPKSVSISLLDFLSVFSDAPLSERRERAFREFYRTLADDDLDWLSGVASMLRERTLPRDLREELAHRPRDADRSNAGARRRRRARERE